MNVTTGDVVLTIGKQNAWDRKEYGDLCLSKPYVVAFDGYGHLLVAEQANETSRIAVFKASNEAPLNGSNGASVSLVTSFHTSFKALNVFVDKNGNVVVGGKQRLFLWSS